MQSIALYTDEIDDLEAVAQEFHDKISAKLPLLKNTCGIIFCDIEADELELTEQLRKYYDFPIVGATAVALLTNDEGYQNTGISFLVLTADDCTFSVGITDEINPENAKVKISDKYQELKAALPEEEKLALVYAPTMTDVSGDYLVKYLNEINPQLPIFGGMASDSFTIADNRVFYNDISSQRAVALILISGNIRPRFQHKYSIISTNDTLHTVTKSVDNVVYEVENGKFIDTLANIGIGIDNEDAYLKFVGTVFEAIVTVDDGQTISVMRDLNKFDFANGSATFLGNVPVGSKMRLCLLNKEDVTLSVRDALKDVLAQVDAEKDYTYSTFLVTSCAGRFLVLSTEPNAEGKAYEGLLPESINICGMYSYGEICPTYTPNGNKYNVFHNKTFTIVAF